MIVRDFQFCCAVYIWYKIPSSYDHLIKLYADNFVYFVCWLTYIICLQDIYSDMLSQNDNIKSTKEHLNSLCRKFQTKELSAVQEMVSGLSTKYDESFKLATKGMLIS